MSYLIFFKAKINKGSVFPGLHPIVSRIATHHSSVGAQSGRNQQPHRDRLAFPSLFPRPWRDGMGEDEDPPS